ncbi:hypothetical protein HNP84_009761 [Thermocatellispora tengchongensis]|uniref:Uncharacterized protein n=1 Tax=Thermocatellispora tengchongensis TaxID=1073253 RepID=A0A840PM62_9ACTN|nr:hypothetical protein [Thermocatellispora tengchongensis]MBB5139996.1 hypothetical protein [Thermocatellispora tengchongensis]
MGGSVTWQIWDAELAYSHTSLTDPEAQGRLDNDGAEPLWGVYQVKPDQMTHIHVFPHNTLEWRAAEYGIDHEDIGTLLDVILYEPFIPDPRDPLMWQDPGALRVAEETWNLPTCWTPGCSDETRLQAHLERIKSVKRNRVALENAPQQDRQAALQFVGSQRTADPDPLAPIRGARLDPVRVQGRRMAVEWRRVSAETLLAPTFQTKPPATFVGMQPLPT